jgi:hypothetical protein
MRPRFDWYGAPSFAHSRRGAAVAFGTQAAMFEFWRLPTDATGSACPQHRQPAANERCK